MNNKKSENVSEMIILFFNSSDYGRNHVRHGIPGPFGSPRPGQQEGQAEAAAPAAGHPRGHDQRHPDRAGGLYTT